MTGADISSGSAKAPRNRFFVFTASEKIDLRDAQRLVHLLTHLAQQGIGPATEQSGSKLDALLTSRLQKYRTKLDPPKGARP